MSGGTDFSELADSLGADIPAMLAEHKVPGLAVGVTDTSGVIWSAGFGTVGAGHHQPVTSSTTFSIQSASKMYTATAVMLAVQQGLVELDEPITAYLPEFSVKSRFESHPERKITLRHLLSHTAGFTHEAPIGGNYEVGRGSFEAHCRSISETWLRFPVGHHFEYSNLGVDLAGYVLQRQSRRPFHDFVHRDLLEPLGLRRTTLDHRRIAGDRDRALGGEGRRRRVPVRVPMVAAGGAYTSVDDALRFLQFHMRGGEDRLAPERLQEMHRIPFAAPGQELGFALGTIVGRWESGVRTYGHGGGGFGFRCELNWAPGLDIGVAVLTNTAGNGLHVQLSQRIFGELAGQSKDHRRPLPPAVEMDPELLGRFTGEYVGGRGGTAAVVRDGDGLAVVLGGEKHAARAVAPDQIALEEGPPATGRQLFTAKPRERFRFVPDEAGRPRYMQSMEDGYVRYRNEPFPSDRPLPFKAEWEGRYAIRSSGVTQGVVELRNDDRGPVLTTGDSEHGSITPLGQHRPGIYFAPDGEALDLTKSPATYANIKLFKL